MVAVFPACSIVAYFSIRDEAGLLGYPPMCEYYHSLIFLRKGVCVNYIQRRREIKINAITMDVQSRFTAIRGNYSGHPAIFKNGVIVIAK